jgi:ethanolamine utilization protein EutN
MELALVVGMAVSTVKDPHLVGQTLLVCRPCDTTGAPSGEGQFVAVDTVGAGTGEIVLVARGSAARVPETVDRVPTDATVVGIVDSVQVDGTTTVVRQQG